MSFGDTMDGGAGPMTTSEPEHTPDATTPGDPCAEQNSAPSQQPEQEVAGMAEDVIRQTTEAVDAMTEDLGDAAPLDLEDFANKGQAHSSKSIGMLGDVDLDVRIELGRTQMLVEDVLKLTPDSVVELDKAAGDPVDIYVNGRHVARGEVLVLNENFCVRVSEIIGKVTAASETA